MGRTVTGTFPTRREAEIAVEHLVQQYGLERTDIFIEPSSRENSAGVSSSGGDAKSGQPDDDAALNGSLLVSVDINEDEMEAVEKAFREAGATDFAVT